MFANAAMRLPMAPFGGAKRRAHGSTVLPSPDVVSDQPLSSSSSDSYRTKIESDLDESIVGSGAREAPQESALASGRPHNRICFGGQVEIRSDPFPLIPTASLHLNHQERKMQSILSMNEFFSNERCRNDFLTDDGVVTTLPRARQDDDDDDDDNKNNNNNNKKFAVNNHGFQRDLLQIEKKVRFWGLIICAATTVTSECMAPPFQRPSRLNFPSYRIELRQSRLDAEGSRPLVWLFRLLTKGSNQLSQKSETRSSVDDEAKTVSASSLTTLHVQSLGDDSGEGVFVSNSQIQINIRVPEFMIKYVPINENGDGDHSNPKRSNRKLSRMEEYGSAVMQRFLEQEFEAALSRFRKTYLEFAASTTAHS